jgi:acyl carrier protein
MPDTVADRVRTIVANAAKLRPSDVQLTSTLDELGIGWLARIEISLEIERAFELPFDAVDDDTEAAWQTVTDIVATAEKLIAEIKSRPAAPGRAA